MYRAIRFTALMIGGMALAACADAPAPDETSGGAPLDQAESARASAPTAAAAEAIDTTDYVRIPGGMLTHRSCAHQIPDGHSVGEDRIVRDAAGTPVRQLPACAYPPVIARREARQRRGEGDGAHGGEVPSTNGWISWVNQHVPSGSSSWTYTLSTWTVPAAPFDTSAVEFYFPGVETSDDSVILQPVLQWGNSAAGGGNYWAIASWEAFSDGSALYTGLQSVSTGDSIIGTIRLQNVSGSFEWLVEAKDLTTGQSKVGTFYNTLLFPNAQPAVHESYGDVDCENPVEFHSIHIDANVTGSLLNETNVAYSPSTGCVSGGPPYCFDCPFVSGNTTTVN